MDESRTRILKAAIKAVRQYGLEGVRIQNISDIAGYTPGALYRYFPSKDELMESCFFYIDRQVTSVYDGMHMDLALLAQDPAAAIKQVWLPYFRFWVTHPDETVFYHRYQDSAHFPTFSREQNAGHFHSLSGVTDHIATYLPGLSQLTLDLVRLHTLAATVMYAEYVVEGILPDSAETENAIYQLIINGLLSCLPPAS